MRLIIKAFYSFTSQIFVNFVGNFGSHKTMNYGISPNISKYLIIFLYLWQM